MCNRCGMDEKASIWCPMDARCFMRQELSCYSLPEYIELFIGWGFGSLPVKMNFKNDNMHRRHFIFIQKRYSHKQMNDFFKFNLKKNAQLVTAGGLACLLL